MSTPEDVPFRRFVSFVVLFDETSERCCEAVLDLRQVLVVCCPDHEVVVVLNGAVAAEVERLRALVELLPGLRVLRLKTSSTTDGAFFAGVAHAIGEHVVTLVGGQDPAAVIPDLLQAASQGHDVLQGTSTGPLPGTPARRIARYLFEWWRRRLTSVTVPERATYLSCLTRTGTDTLLALRTRPRDLRSMLAGLDGRVAFPYSLVSGTHRSPVTHRDVLRGLDLAPTALLPVAKVAGPVAVAGSVCLTAWSLAAGATGPGGADASHGFAVLGAATVLVLSMSSWLQVSYISSVVRQTREEPGYEVLEEMDSIEQVTEPARRNTTDGSER